MSRAHKPTYHEGPEAAWRFDYTLRRLISVPKEELAKREAASHKGRLAKRNRPKTDK